MGDRLGIKHIFLMWLNDFVILAATPQSPLDQKLEKKKKKN
jgi:hypothetical protein